MGCSSDPDFDAHNSAILIAGGARFGRRTPGPPNGLPRRIPSERASECANMFLPKGYLSFRSAALLLSDDTPDAGFDFARERLGNALANKELAADGILVSTVAHDDNVPEVGQIRRIRTEIWRTPQASQAVLRLGATEPSIHQDGFRLVPIIKKTAFDTWHEAVREGHPPARADVSSGPDDILEQSYDVPTGYVTFEQITTIVRAWANNGKIDPDLMRLLAPPDTDAITQALATGSLRAFGVSKRTGEIVSLPPAVWQMEVSGVRQAVWTIGGKDILADPDGDPYLPVISCADLARIFQAKEIPPEPDELPEGWQAAVPLERPSSVGSGVVEIDAWMRGLAQGCKLRGAILKRVDAVKTATTHLSCTTRQAEAAYEALPYPDLRNPPRVAGA